jgi:hypothetical protein
VSHGGHPWTPLLRDAGPHWQGCQSQDSTVARAAIEDRRPVLSSDRLLPLVRAVAMMLS